MFIGPVERIVNSVDRRVVSVARTFGAPPDQADRTDWQSRQAKFLLSWSFWDGSAYEVIKEWARYKQDHGLLEDIRTFETFVKRVVDFWWYHVYSGELAEDGLTLPGGVQNAIPLASDTNPQLAKAFGQLWQWWGWVSGMRTTVLYAATTGNCVVELNDDLTRRKVLSEVVWPGYVSDLELDNAQNVIAWAKQYEAEAWNQEERRLEVFTYRREVDKEWIRTFKGTELFDYDGFGAERRNPYGFVPAVRYIHEDTGGTWGEPAFHGVQGILDRINSIYTAMYSHLEGLLDAPFVVTGSMPPGSIAAQMRAHEAELNGDNPDLLNDPYATDPPDTIRVPKRSFRLVQGAPDSRLEYFKADVTAVREMIRDLVSGAEENFPEIRFWSEIRKMSAITEPGVESALGDVYARLRTISSQHDRQTKKLMQMGVAIAGMRYNDGSWKASADRAGVRLTPAHDVFKPFSLTSYEERRLNFQIMPRKLVEETELDRLEAAERMRDLGMPEEAAWERAGITEEVRQEWIDKGWIPDPDAEPEEPEEDPLEALLAGGGAPQVPRIETPVPGAPGASQTAEEGL